MKQTLTILYVALSATFVNAQTVDNWLSQTGPVKSGADLCWRNSSWTPATAHQDCDGALKPVKVAAANIDITKPTPVIAVRSPAPREKKETINADTLFDFDKSNIKAEGKVKLDQLVTDVAKIELEVAVVVGHTDSVGTDKYNIGLGQRRADSVKSYLVSKGIDGKRIYTESKGESQPVDSNKTREGRAKNRRVEIEIVGAIK